MPSPVGAAWAVGVLIEAAHPIWGRLIAPARRASATRGPVADAEQAVGRASGAATIAEARQRFGPPLSGTLQLPPDPRQMLQPRLIESRMALRGMDAFALPAEDAALRRVEERLWVGSRAALSSGLLASPVGPIVAQSFFSEYGAAWMAADEAAVGSVSPPQMLPAAWTVARSSGPWWPFLRGAILAERPREVHVDADGLLHRTDGPAVVYRDGMEVFAWHGQTVPKAWIAATADVPAAELRGFDPTFRQYAETKRKAAGGRPPRRLRPSALFTMPLPLDPDARIEQLRARAGGQLPLLDRYRGGEHAAVWAELVKLGPGVREDPNAADALAVACDTMCRVAANVRTLVERLRALDYRFAEPGGRAIEPSQAHVAPTGQARRTLLRIEKAAGPLPISIGAFHEFVGAVAFTGGHPVLAPADGSVAPDPLVVDALESAVDSLDDEDEDGPAFLALAPDDLHKANTSGGDPYGITVPDLRADAEFLNERHGLLFVEYLRLCFRWGGFPGYEGTGTEPVVLETLRGGLVEF